MSTRGRRVATYEYFQNIHIFIVTLLFGKKIPDNLQNKAGVGCLEKQTYPIWWRRLPEAKNVNTCNWTCTLEAKLHGEVINTLLSNLAETICAATFKCRVKTPYTFQALIYLLHQDTACQA